MWHLLRCGRASDGRYLSLYQRGTAGYFYTIDILKAGEVVEQVHIYDSFEVADKKFDEISGATH